jgi:hypothetical protein
MRTFFSESDGVLKTLTLYQLLSFEYFVQNSSSFLISSKFIIFCLFEIFLLLKYSKKQKNIESCRLHTKTGKGHTVISLTLFISHVSNFRLNLSIVYPSSSAPSRSIQSC